MPKEKLTLDEINSASFSHFLAAFSHLIEQNPVVTAVVSMKRPFKNLRHFHAAICDAISQLGPDYKEAILKLYPDLGGKLDSLSSFSQDEHKTSGLLGLSAEQLDELKILNAEFVAQNAYPFVLCMKEHKSLEVAELIRSRLRMDKSTGLEVGIIEVFKIAWYRLLELCHQDESAVDGPAVCGNYRTITSPVSC